MKKIILSLILALIVIFSCVSPAFAADSGIWVLHNNAEFIMHDGVKYVIADNMKTSDYSYGYMFDEILGYSKIDLEATPSMYNGATATVRTGNKDFVVETYIPSLGYRLYVTENYMDTFRKLQNGDAESYILKTQYNIEMELAQEDYLTTLTTPITIDKISTSYYDWIDLYSTHDATKLSVLSGAVLRSKSTGDMYILRYSDFDSSHFYADGTFARLDSGKKYTVYKIMDRGLRDDINDLIDARPDDELNWIVGKDPSYISKLISAVIFFGVIPLAIIVFCVIMLKKAKKKMYRAPLITLIASAAALMIAAAILYF